MYDKKSDPDISLDCPQCGEKNTAGNRRHMCPMPNTGALWANAAEQLFPEPKKRNDRVYGSPPKPNRAQRRGNYPRAEWNPNRGAKVAGW